MPSLVETRGAIYLSNLAKQITRLEEQLLLLRRLQVITLIASCMLGVVVVSVDSDHFTFGLQMQMQSNERNQLQIFRDFQKKRNEPVKPFKSILNER